jgi:maltokinase
LGSVRPGASAELVEALATGGAMAGLCVRRFVPLAPGPLGERPITVDQTNTSVVVGERVVVKWLRPQAGNRSPARAPDLLAHLVAAGFTRTPTPYAAVYRDRPSDLVAIVTAYLPGAADGWEWCVDVLLDQLDGGPPVDLAGGIGALAAELHCALATPSETIPAPVAEVTHPTWAADGLAVLERARRLVSVADDEDARWFTARVGRLAADIEQSRQVVEAYVIHPHGDLHVGQVLRWRGGLAVTDFDGNPTLTAPGTSVTEPAARDVAQLCTSLLHVGQIADRRTGGRHRPAVADWCRRSVDDLLAAYRHTLHERGMAHLFDERLLRPFEVEQECRELVYAARFLPRWRYAPLGVLRSWYD